jgi:adenylate kinase
MKQVIIILGAPGSGKGTQASLLADKFHLYYFETSKILEEVFEKSGPEDYFKVAGKVFKVAKEKELWEKGILNSPPFVTHLVCQKLANLADQNFSLVLAGSPRTLYEAKKVLPLLMEKYGKEIKVFFLDIDLKDSITRNSRRKICQLLRHPLLWSKETENLTKCPLDGSQLMTRALDKPQVIKKRWQEFKRRTLPIVDYLEKEGIQVIKIDGRPSAFEVFNNLLKFLNGQN